MKKFSDLKFKDRNKINGTDGIDAKMFFRNGYGVSVIKGFGTYGNEEGLYELAVLKGTKDNWDLDYTTEITENVMGYLTPEEIDTIMIKIQNLEEK